MVLLIPLLIALGVVALDQVSKLLIVAKLYDSAVTVIPNLLRFTYVENEGMAFGLLAEHRWIFLVLSVVGIGAVGYYLYRFAETKLSRVSLSLVIGGGIGNMIDRVFRGFVVDFIDFYFLPFWIWVFNIADAAVCVGAALFALDLLLHLRDSGKKEDTV